MNISPQSWHRNQIGLKNHWKFDETTNDNGMTTTDSGPDNNAGTLTNYPEAMTCNGIINTAFNFNATTPDHVDFGNIHDDAGPFSVHCWFYPTGAYNYFGSLLSKAGKFFIAVMPQATGQILFQCGTNTFSDYSWNWNTWNHLVCTFDGYNIAIYLNGYKTSNQYSPTFTLGGSMMAGSYPNYDPYGYDGAIDDIKYYNYAIDDTYADWLYNYGYGQDATDNTQSETITYG